MKAAKKSKTTNFDQLKAQLASMNEFKDRAEWYKEECRINRITNKI